MFIYNQQEDTFIPIICLTPTNLPINTICATEQGKVYIGTIGYGIKVYDTHTENKRK